MADTLNEGEIKALIHLLDEDDDNILQQVKSKLFSYGKLAIPFLEERYLNEKNEALQTLINDAIEEIYFEDLKKQILNWMETGGVDLFEGMYLSCLFKYPQLNRQALSNQLDKIKLDIWLELNTYLSSVEKVKIINRILFEKYGLRGNTDNYFAPDNSFINKVLETKYGNPISLAVIYSIIAQRLNLPIFGVNLPQHFILVYQDDSKIIDRGFNAIQYLEHSKEAESLFYINSFNRGAIFSETNIRQFLQQLKIEPLDFYFHPCSNIDILLRVFRNAENAYIKLEDSNRVEKIGVLIKLIEPFASQNFLS